MQKSGTATANDTEMSGVKRRTPYRKHITHDMMNEAPELDESTIVARILRAHGTNLFEVSHKTLIRSQGSICQRAARLDETTTRTAILPQVEDQHGNTGLCMLPTKFRKLVWVRKGEYVLVSKSDGDVSTAAGTKGSVTYMIERPILREHVKELVRAGTWPDAFETEFRGTGDAAGPPTAGDAYSGKAVPGDGPAASGAGADDSSSKRTDGLVDLGGMAMGMGQDLGLTEGDGGEAGEADTDAGKAADEEVNEDDEEEEDDLDF